MRQCCCSYFHPIEAKMQINILFLLAGFVLFGMNQAYFKLLQKTPAITKVSKRTNCKMSKFQLDKLNSVSVSLSKIIATNPILRGISKAYSYFYWFPRKNMVYDRPWRLFRNSTIEWFAWYQFPHNLPPYKYLEDVYPNDFFCWGLPGNTLPLGNWDPWGLQLVAPSVVRKYRESELKHGRLAMLSSVGFLLQELLHPQNSCGVGGLAIGHMSQLRHCTHGLLSSTLNGMFKISHLNLPGTL